MPIPQHAKSSVDDIRRRFDNDVERFSNLETGQSATIDAPLVMELIAAAAAQVSPHAKAALDIGCGAGNYSLKLLGRLPDVALTLVDLSRPMLDRAVDRLAAAGARHVAAVQGDIRDLKWPAGTFDIAMAAASLHHLRGDDEWRLVFERIFAGLRPGGGFWIADLVAHDRPAVQELMWQRYGEHLAAAGGPEYRDRVLAYVDLEDTPRSVTFQTDLLRAVGFTQIELLHKNGCFAAFGGIKGP